MSEALNTAHWIDDTLEHVAERIGDPGPLVYERLFVRAPELEALFVLDTDGGVRGEMMFRALDLLRDLASDEAFADDLLAIEVRNHLGYGVPLERFALFYAILAEIGAEAAGDAWQPEHEAAWRRVMDRVTAVTAKAAQPD